ncbi:MAG: hypothetical protein HUJ26_06720 [Planctomycetaceae bacterium]|nr:hypothetical protein [Planctomycetaceae bacterium]
MDSLKTTVATFAKNHFAILSLAMLIGYTEGGKLSFNGRGPNLRSRLWKNTQHHYLKRSKLFCGNGLKPSVGGLCVLLAVWWISTVDAQDVSAPDLSSAESARRRQPPALPEADPESAELPEKWFEFVPVKPIGGLGLSPDENEPYYRILNHVKNLPEKTLERANRQFRLAMIDQFEARTLERIAESGGSEAQQKALRRQLEKRLAEYRENPATYPFVRDAYNFAEQCQGEVVSFSGHIRQADSFPAGKNDFGLETLYQITLFDEESKGFPVIIVCTEVPENFPLNFPDTEVYDGVSVTGYYFKLFAYEGKEDLQAVPLILAKSVDWNPPEPVSRDVPDWVYGFAIAVGVVALWLVVRSSRSSRHLKSVRAEMSSPADNPFADPNSSSD